MQKILGTYASIINLSDYSFKEFLRFGQQILPIHGHNIRHLIIKDAHQFNIFCNESILLQKMKFLRHLTLTGSQYSIKRLDIFLKNLPSLNILQLKLINDMQALDDILSNNMSSLIQLNFLQGDKYYFNDTHVSRQSNIKLPLLKSLTIDNLKKTKDL